jgi:KDO2-lipid IV(A) lauroyltransferase
MHHGDPQQPKWRSFAAPKFWPTWAGLAVLRLLHQLPFHWQLGIGRQLGRLARRFLGRRVHIARTNINLCFPQLSPEQRSELLDQHFEAIGMGLFESAMGWWGSNARITALGEVTGIEHLVAATERKQGVILLTGHFSTMELAGAMLSARHPMSAMYRPMKNPLMDQVVLAARRAKLKSIFPRDDIPSMVKGLKQGEIIWYGFDQNYGKKHSLFTPFFKIPAATITTTSRFARMGKAIVIPYFPVRKKDGRYRITIHPPLDDFPSTSLDEDNIRLNHMLEQAILQAPEQYFWIHRRFKTRPAHEPAVY